MKIKKVILQNIGVYVNRNEFDLQADKPIILIGGMNGRGKTTFLESILFALYGRRSLDSGIKQENYLRKVSNVTGNQSMCFIEIQFSVQEQGKDAEYAVRRYWDIDRNKIVLKTIVWKNREESQALSENWDMFVEEILPRAIASFFFFDGEKIAELAATENDAQIQSSIRALLGIDMINQLISDLHTVASSYQKLLGESKSKNELEKIETEISKQEQRLEEKETEYQQIQDMLTRLREEREKLENEYAVTGGAYAEYQGKVRNQKKQVEQEIEENEGKLLELAASSLPLKLVEPLLAEIQSAANDEQNQREISIFLNQFPQLYTEYTKSEKWSPEIQNFLLSVKEKVGESNNIYNLDEDTLVRLEEITSILREETQQAEELLKIKRNLNRKMEEIDNYLAVEVEDTQIQTIHQHLTENSYQIGQAEAKLHMLKENCEGLISNLETHRKMRKQLLWKMVKEQEESDDNNRMVTYAHEQIEIMRAYKNQLQALKADELAKQMTECFSKIISKEGLIQKITINPETLEFCYYNKKGQRIYHQMLSSGEKQILVIAMLWALGICSKAEFPLIIDTPLARLDSVHRTSLIENYFPKASQQVIILSTDQEITSQDYQALKKYVGKEYTLVYDGDTMSSAVCPGYFGGKKS